MIMPDDLKEEWKSAAHVRWQRHPVPEPAHMRTLARTQSSPARRAVVAFGFFC
jgi:hypothetical protein